MHPSFCVKDFLGVWPECHCLLNYFQLTYWSWATVISLPVYFFIPSVAPVGLRLTGESRRFPTAELRLHARQPCWDSGSIVSKKKTPKTPNKFKGTAWVFFFWDIICDHPGSQCQQPFYKEHQCYPSPAPPHSLFQDSLPKKATLCLSKCVCFLRSWVS